VIPFPPAPVPPSSFFSDFLPKAFAEAGLPPGSENLDLKLGIELTGPGGGEWVFEVEGRALRVREAPRDATAFTVRQSVADWRGALWGGRGGAVARQAMSIFRPGEPPVPGPAGLAGPPSPAALALLGAARGSLRLVVAGGSGGDWQVEFKLGPGKIPGTPTTTVTIQAEDADRMERGELNPMEAFMAGRIQVTGDMALLMQLQAAQMQATMAAAAAGAPGAPE
jgi:putative sterol carrier protein